MQIAPKFEYDLDYHLDAARIFPISLNDEKAQAARENLMRQVRAAAKEAHAAGLVLDYGPIESTRPSLEDVFSPRSLFDPWVCEIRVQTRVSEPDAPIMAGWTRLGIEQCR